MKSNLAYVTGSDTGVGKTVLTVLLTRHLLDQGVAVRSGHHCAHPLMQYYGVPATCRASFAFYNTEAEIDALVAGIGKVRRMLG